MLSDCINPVDRLAKVVGDRGWVVLTKDKAIAKNQLELVAIARAEVKVFIPTSGNLTRQDMADTAVCSFMRDSNSSGQTSFANA
jgi:PIN like domain